METHTPEKIIADHPFFAELESYYATLLVSCASNARFAAREYILREGEEANEFFLIPHGDVAIEMNPPHRRPIVVDTVGEGEILGWSWLLPPYTWRFHGRAADAVRAVALDGKCLRNKCEQNHDLGYDLLKPFAQIMNRRLDADPVTGCIWPTLRTMPCYRNLGLCGAYRKRRRTRSRLRSSRWQTMKTDPLPHRTFQPGQFSMLWVFGVGELPISISGDPVDTRSLTYTVRSVGPATQALVSLRSGESVGVRGPFGTGWPVEAATGRDIVVVGGASAWHRCGR